jgi:hypothetical protein
MLGYVLVSEKKEADTLIETVINRRPYETRD